MTSELNGYKNFMMLFSLSFPFSTHSLESDPPSGYSDKKIIIKESIFLSEFQLSTLLPFSCFLFLQKSCFCMLPLCLLNGNGIPAYQHHRKHYKTITEQHTIIKKFRNSCFLLWKWNIKTKNKVETGDTFYPFGSVHIIIYL